MNVGSRKRIISLLLSLVLLMADWSAQAAGTIQVVLDGNPLAMDDPRDRTCAFGEPPMDLTLAATIVVYDLRTDKERIYRDVVRCVFFRLRTLKSRLALDGSWDGRRQGNSW
ncbi:MAG TPA: hypothetical protein VGK74_17980 [Symbiobacteriaceae bacterium]